MSTGAIINILVGVVVVVLVVARQMQTRSVRENSAVRIVLILGIFGIIELFRTLGGHSVGATTVAWIVGSLIVAGLFGVARALTVKIWRVDAGLALRRGTVATAILWAVSFGAHLAMEVGINDSTTVTGLGASSVLLYLAVTLGSQREVVRWRAAQLGPEPRQP